MNALIALLREPKTRRVVARLEERGWSVALAADGVAVDEALRSEPFTVMLLHVCLPRLNATAFDERLRELPCPPRVLLLSEPELGDRLTADCRAPIAASDAALVRLTETLARKPFARAAQAGSARRHVCVESALNALAFPRAFKGRAYIAWLVEALLPNPHWGDQLTHRLYPACARAFGTSPAAVERCVRIAVEERFIHGDMAMLERYFGSTVDPERGKPTNRAFLLELSERLRTENAAPRQERGAALIG